MMVVRLVAELTVFGLGRGVFLHESESVDEAVLFILFCYLLVLLFVLAHLTAIRL